MEKERERAMVKGYPSPIQIDKESCDRDFNNAVKLCIDHIEKLSVIIASHNDYSNMYGIKMMQEKKLPNNAGSASEPLPGFKEIQPQVFAGLYPTEANQYDALRDALEKLQLNDASLQFEPEVSQALGFGFRCGFLGLLHMEIVQERLEREFNQDLITTAPSVVYEVVKGDGEVIMVENPSKMPEQARIQEIREPIVTVHLYMPQEYVGPVMTLANQKRGVQLNMSYHGRQVMLTYDLP